MRSRSKLFAATAVLVGFAGGVAHATERRPWLSLDLIDSGGAPTSSDRLVRHGTWVVVLTMPGCGPCDTLLASLDAAAIDRPDLSSQLAVIVVADAASIGREAARFPHLADARWLADPSDGLRHRLDTGARPLVLGLRERAIEWSVTGVLTSFGDVRTAIVSWLGK